MKAIIQDNFQIKVPTRKNHIPWWVPAGFLAMFSGIPSEIDLGILPTL